MRIVKEFRDNPFAPWHRAHVATLLRQVANSLGSQARVVEEVPRPGPDAQVSGDDLLILRKRRVGFGRDIDQWIALIEADEAPVPATVRGVVGAHGDQPASGSVPSPAPDAWRSTAEALLLPLAANPEQEEIARRLARHPGVVVQGPPGTGKSHTIANLVCHLLAHGKTVLITSQTERALKVLRDKVPESIRSLCVSVIGSDVDAQEELKRSVQRIVEETGGSQERQARAAAEAREQLSRVRRQLGELWAELGRASQRGAHRGQHRGTGVDPHADRPVSERAGGGGRLGPGPSACHHRVAPARRRDRGAVLPPRPFSRQISSPRPRPTSPPSPNFRARPSSSTRWRSEFASQPPTRRLPRPGSSGRLPDPPHVKSLPSASTTSGSTSPGPSRTSWRFRHRGPRPSGRR